MKIYNTLYTCAHVHFEWFEDYRIDWYSHRETANSSFAGVHRKAALPCYGQLIAPGLFHRGVFLLACRSKLHTS